MRQLESQIQQSCVKWFRCQFPTLAKLLFAVPNGGARNVVTAARLKAEGVVAGVSDLLLLYPSNGYHGLCIEMKTAKSHQSELQKEWQLEVEKYGYKYVCCKGTAEFINNINEYIKKG